LIRLANRYDNDKIMELLREFCFNSKNPMTNDSFNWSKTYTEQLLATLYAGRGFVLIDEKQTGILVAAKFQSFWRADKIQLQEIMLHSNNKFVIVRLIKEYIKIAKEMLEKNEIQQAIMGSYEDYGFERFGMVKLEQHWEVK
jgi:hypothetical protein